jgi:hypothetical protein
VSFCEGGGGAAPEVPQEQELMQREPLTIAAATHPSWQCHTSRCWRSRSQKDSKSVERPKRGEGTPLSGPAAKAASTTASCQATSHTHRMAQWSHTPPLAGRSDFFLCVLYLLRFGRGRPVGRAAFGVFVCLCETNCLNKDSAASNTSQRTPVKSPTRRERQTCAAPAREHPQNP